MKKLILSLSLLIGIFSLPLPSQATVQNTTNTVQYAGDGVSTSFFFNNNVYLQTDLVVYEVVNNVTTTLTLNVNYTVSLTAVSGTTGAYTANINLSGGSNPSGALPIGTTLVITRSVPYTQLINISDYSATPAATWNQALDRSAILSQQLLNLSNRSVLQPVTATSPITFPTGQANYGLCWDSTGTYITNCTTYAGGAISVPIANSNLQTLTQANLVNGSSIVTNTIQSGAVNWTSLAAAIQPTGVNWQAISNFNNAQVNWGILAPATTGNAVNWTSIYSVMPYVKVSETEAAGTNAGTSSTGSWIARVLNTKDSDTGGIASLCTGNGAPVATCTAANQVVLPVGTYYVTAKAPFNQPTQTQLRIQNITAGTTLVIGTSVYWSSGILFAPVSGYFTLSSTSAIALQYQVAAGVSTTGLGQNCNFGTEVYAQVEFNKLK